jgi:hypothetical protein|tara:strand:+ start:38 stop:208 length:171 start_codon:yes stop_codon:yes gene_type:complete
MTKILENKLDIENMIKEATEVQLTELLFCIVKEMDVRLQDGRTSLAFRVVIKDKSS